MSTQRLITERLTPPVRRSNSWRRAAPHACALALVLTVALPSLATPGVAAVAADAPRGSAAAALDPFLTRLFELAAAPGMVVTVVQGDEVVYLRGFGHADLEAERLVGPDTVFYIASSTKSFTGTAASILHQRGTLDLDAPLTRSLPELRLHPPLRPRAISLRDLLTHTHGIGSAGPVSFRAAYSGDHSPALLLDLMRHHPPAERGTAFAYSNIGYNLASLAIDRVLGKSWKDVLREELFEPLGMASTTAYGSQVAAARRATPYRPRAGGFSRLPYSKGDENMHAAGGMMTTGADLARWLEANLNGGRVDGQQAIPAAAVREAQRPQAEQSVSRMGFERTGYGLGWNTGTYAGRPFIHHFGAYSGFHAHVSFMPAEKIGVAILTNSGLGMPVASLAARMIYDTLRGAAGDPETLDRAVTQLGEQLKQIRARFQADHERRAARPQTLAQPLAAYAGRYANPLYGTLELKVVDGKLEATMGRLWSAVEVYDQQQNALRVELTGNGQVLVFSFDEGKENDAGTRATGCRYDDLDFRRIDDRPPLGL